MLIVVMLTIIVIRVVRRAVVAMRMMTVVGWVMMRMIMR